MSNGSNGFLLLFLNVVGVVVVGIVVLVGTGGSYGRGRGGRHWRVVVRGAGGSS